MTTRVPAVDDLPRSSGGDPDFFLEPIVHTGELVKREVDLAETRADGTQMDLRAIEDRLLERGMDIVEGVMHAPDLTKADLEDPDAGPPPLLIERLGLERATRVFASAKQGWANQKDAPIFVKTAENMVKSIIKSRSTQMAAPTTLNVAIINNSHTYEYNEVEVEDE